MFEWARVPDDRGRAALRLAGAITERTDLDPLLAEIRAAPGPVRLVADGVRYINSTGLQRLWQFVCALDGRDIVLDRCAPAVVTQLNLMPALADRVRVASVIAPLECTQCVAEADTLIRIDGTARPRVPPRACEVCGADMVLAELEDRYFAFLASG